MTALAHVPGDSWTSTAYRNGPLRVTEWIGTSMKWSCKCGVHGLETDTPAAMKMAQKHYDESHEARPVTDAVAGRASFIETIFNIFYTLLQRYRGPRGEHPNTNIRLNYLPDHPRKVGDDDYGTFRLVVTSGDLVAERDIPDRDIARVWQEEHIGDHARLIPPSQRSRNLQHRITDAIDGALRELKEKERSP